jgi:hypothetical protein
MRARRTLLALLLIGAALAAEGCIIAAVGAGAGTIAYMKGDLEAVETKNIDQVFDASIKALEQLDMKITEQRKDGLSARISARDSGDRKVAIKLSATAEGATKLSIRIGTFGSETRSRLIHEQIKQNLK